MREVVVRLRWMIWALCVQEDLLDYDAGFLVIGLYVV